MSELRDTPFHVDVANYTSQEAEALQRFMEGDYQSFELPHGPRDGIFRIETPPLPEAKEIQETIMASVLDELKSCHPLLKRRDKFVRFVSTLVEKEDLEGKFQVGGDMLYIEPRQGKIKYYLRIALDELEGMDSEDLVANVTGIILHELAETDYFLKSPVGTENKKDNLGTDDYYQEEDEVIANRRTIRALKSKYPQAGFTEVKYPIDET